MLREIHIINRSMIEGPIDRIIVSKIVSASRCPPVQYVGRNRKDADIQ